MDKIICLVGESGSGKSTIGELLEKEGYNYIQSFTTRPPRFEGEKGHIFSTIEQYKKDKSKGIVTAETYFNNNYYWTTSNQFKGNCLYIVDPTGVKYLKENAKDAEIIVIYLKCSKHNRYIRMMARDKDNNKVLDRIEHDEIAFKDVVADYIINADKSVKKILEDIMLLIK